MGHTFHPHSNLVSKSELYLFSLPSTQPSIFESLYSSFNPISSVSGYLVPIEFIIPACGDLLIDPSHIHLYIKGRIEKPDGTALPEDSSYYPENNILHSLFTNVDVYLNDVNCSNGGSNYHYRAFLETLLNFNDDAKSTLLGAEGYYKDATVELHSIKMYIKRK